MKVAELKDKPRIELKQHLNKLLRQLFGLKIKMANHDEGVKPHLIKKTRRDIARVKTLLNQNETEK